MMRAFLCWTRPLARALGGVSLALTMTLAVAQDGNAALASAPIAAVQGPSLAASAAPPMAAEADVASAAAPSRKGATEAREGSARVEPVTTRTAPAKPGNALNIALPSPSTESQTALALRVVMGLTLLAVLPSLLICTTAFLRIIIVLSMLRQAIGMPETPPNPVLVGLALFLTLFTMQPVFQSMSHDAIQPFMEGRITATVAYEGASKPLRDFMIRQTREHDLALMVELSKAPQPRTIEDVGLVQLVPAFILSELRAAFQIGFVIFLPFLLIDLIVSSILMALGMMMMPPVTVSLPLKILMFVLVDGWSLILKALVGSFH
jgi:flagellar biosynthetic protein FliP